MMVSRLLKSWATPAASRPTASIFWACRNCSSRMRPFGDVLVDDYRAEGVLKFIANGAAEYKMVRRRPPHARSRLPGREHSP